MISPYQEEEFMLRMADAFAALAVFDAARYCPELLDGESLDCVFVEESPIYDALMMEAGLLAPEFEDCFTSSDYPEWWQAFRTRLYEESKRLSVSVAHADNHLKLELLRKVLKGRRIR